MKIFTIKLVLFLMILAQSLVSSGATHNSNSTGGGDWGINSTWVGNSPGYKLGQHTTVNIYANDEVISSQTIEFSGNNLTTINVWGTLIINGDLSVSGNNLKVNVYENGRFVINGSVGLSNGANFEIDGDVVIDGDIEGGGGSSSITGSGNLYISGENNFAGDTNEFEGIIADDIPANEIPAPVMEIGDVERDGYNERLVHVYWSFDTNINYTIEGEEYTFAGFRIVRNLEGNNHSEQILRGYFVYEDETFLGFDNSITTEYYQDYISGDDIDEIEGEIYPEYYVRAVYVKVNSTKSESRSDYVLSPNSTTQSSADPLPIELLSFTAKAQNESVNIEWVTAAEINNDFFTLYRSGDGYNWEIITYMQGAGNSNHTLNYNYTDMQPLPGINYYRLKQTDFDGQFEYFAPIAVQFNKAEEANKIMHVRANGQSMNLMVKNQDPTAQIVVADMHGRLIYAQGAPVSDYAQEVRVDFPRNYTGEVVLIRLQSGQNADERKIIIR